MWFKFLVKLPYHTPPQGISIAGEACLALLIHSILLRQVDKVGGKDQAEKADVQGGDQLLENKLPKEYFMKMLYMYLTIHITV